MYYGQKIYSDEKIYSESIDVQEKFVELYNDIFFYVYTDSIGLTVHTCNWELYRRETINQNFILVDKGTTNNATIKINLNDYNLQTKDNNFLLKVFEEDKLVSENIFWYYLNRMLKHPQIVHGSQEMFIFLWEKEVGVWVLQLFIKKNHSPQL